VKAIVVKEDGVHPTLGWEEIPDISYGPEEVLVDVWATSVNRADLIQAQGNYPPPPGASNVLGLEMAGIISEVGPLVEGWKPGDRVCALLPGGGYAEKAAVPHRMLLRLPPDWSFAYGAAVPEAWYTVFVNLFLEGNLKKGEIVLIHAGGSGVGTAAVQLAKAYGARVFVTAGSKEKLACCRSLGVELAIDYKTQDFLSEIRAATDQKGVDLILDPVGGSFLEKNLKVLRPFGRLVNIGLLGGPIGIFDMSQVLGKRLKIIGSVLRTRPLAEKIEISDKFRDQIWPLFESGQLHPVIDSIFDIQDVGKAHLYVEMNKNIGKVVLSVRKHR
jgi:putative PIG3 family NAD(P)H quinone oxidoreductase